MSRERRQENEVLTYEGNICKRVIDALERRLVTSGGLSSCCLNDRERVNGFSVRRKRGQLHKISIYGLLVHVKLFRQSPKR